MRPATNMKNSRVALVFALLVVASCGGDGPVEPPAVASVSVAPAGPSLQIGATQQFSATAKDANGGSIGGVSVTWSSTSSTVATITPGGLATAVGAGTTTIRATISGVSASQLLTVQPAVCTNTVTVLLEVGQHQAYPSSECLLLPSGSNLDAYRLAIIRPTEVENTSDVVTATVKVTGIGTQATAASPTAASSLREESPFPKIAGEPFARALRIRESTRRFHARLRQAETEIDLRPEALVPPRIAAAPALLADPPAKRTLNAQLSCSAAKNTHVLVNFNDDLAIYQDSTERATIPISQAATQRMLNYYSSYVRALTEQYWGPISDIDGNGRVVITTATNLADSVAAVVFSGDLTTSGTCQNGNRMEIMYFSASLIREMDDANPNWAPLGTMAHEAKHVVSIFNRIQAAAAAGGVSQFHPFWIEEGTAEVAESNTSRLAWSKTGGPPLGAQVTGSNILSFVQNNGGAPSPEMWGIVEKLANLIVQTSTHPNSLITNPQGAHDLHTFYAAGWHFHRFISDAFGGAATPGADAPLFVALTSASAARGTAGLAQQTGRSFTQLFEDLVVAMSLVGTSAPAPTRAFTTYDWPTALNIFAGPEFLAPPGAYPWPVTTNPATGSPSADFTSRTLTGPVGPSGMRFFDFQSNGTGTGAQIEIGMSPPAQVIVTRLR